jgi:hypothetical protein
VEIVILKTRELFHDDCFDQLWVPEQNNWLTEFEDTSALVTIQLPETAIERHAKRTPKREFVLRIS